MKEITYEMVRKMKFVQDNLEPLMRRLDPKITAVVYTYDHGSGEEVVSVCRNADIVNVCVTADSLAALTMDVVRSLTC
ncbi:MAG: hypothetical protein IKY33_01565 [Clostridia bacterium]|nr:hypothetical protein [Clostridia bacterium]